MDEGRNVLQRRIARPHGRGRLARVAEHLEQRAVEEHEAAVTIDHGDAVAHAVQRALQLRGAVADDVVVDAPSVLDRSPLESLTGLRRRRPRDERQCDGGRRGDGGHERRHEGPHDRHHDDQRQHGEERRPAGGQRLEA